MLINNVELSMYYIDKAHPLRLTEYTNLLIWRHQTHKCN